MIDRAEAVKRVVRIIDDAAACYVSKVIYPSDVLVGWETENGPEFVAVRSYLGCVIYHDEAIEMAMDWIDRVPDYIL